MSNASDPKGSASQGSRNDDSSLFSLEALKQKDEAKKKTTEDSGLIDLKALAAMEKSAEKPSSGLEVAAVVAPADIFGSGLGTPLIAPPPAAAVAAPPPDLAPAPKKSNMGLIIGGAIGAVGIAAAVFMATRGGSAPAATPQAAAVTATVAAATATAAPAPEPEEPKVAAVTPGQREKPAPTAAAPAPEKPASAPVAKVPGPLPKAAPKAPPPPAAPAPPPKPACDLACQMQRAVSKGK